MVNSGESSGYKAKYPVQTLEKALEILLYMKHNTTVDGVSLAELSEALGMGKSTVHRLLDTLLAYNFVEKTYTSSSYKLGWEAYDVGSAVPVQHALHNINLNPILEELCRECLETVNFGIMNQNSVMVLAQAEPNTRIRAKSNIGGAEPLYCTSIGKLFLSQLSMVDLEAYFANTPIALLTPHTIGTAEDMALEVKTIVANGYAMDAEEFCFGLTCIAVPVYDYSGKMIAGISISGPTERMTPDALHEILPQLQKTSRSVSAYLGYQ